MTRKSENFKNYQESSEVVDAEQKSDELPNQCLWTEEDDARCMVRLPKGQHICNFHQKIVNKARVCNSRARFKSRGIINCKPVPK